MVSRLLVIFCLLVYFLYTSEVAAADGKRPPALDQFKARNHVLFDEVKGLFTADERASMDAALQGLLSNDTVRQIIRDLFEEVKVLDGSGHEGTYEYGAEYDAEYGEEVAAPWGLYRYREHDDPEPYHLNHCFSCEYQVPRANRLTSWQTRRSTDQNTHLKEPFADSDYEYAEPHDLAPDAEHAQAVNDYDPIIDITDYMASKQWYRWLDQDFSVSSYGWYQYIFSPMDVLHRPDPLSDWYPFGEADSDYDEIEHEECCANREVEVAVDSDDLGEIIDELDAATGEVSPQSNQNKPAPLTVEEEFYKENPNYYSFVLLSEHIYETLSKELEREPSLAKLTKSVRAFAHKNKTRLSQPVFKLVAYIEKLEKLAAKEKAACAKQGHDWHEMQYAQMPDYEEGLYLYRCLTKETKHLAGHALFIKHGGMGQAYGFEAAGLIAMLTQNQQGAATLSFFERDEQIGPMISWNKDRDALAISWHKSDLYADVILPQREYYENGQLKYEIETGTKDHYRERLFFDNGQLASDVLLRGKDLVQLRRFHKNGKKAEDAGFKDGQLAGLRRWWHDNGKLAGEATYFEGQLDGKAALYHDNGKLAFRATYAKNRAERSLEHWYADGSQALNVSTKEGYLHGALQFKLPDGQLVVQRNYDDGNPSGKWSWFSPESGMLQKTVNYDKDGDVHGDLELFDPNGRQRLAINFDQGKPTALRLVDAKGRPLVTATFEIQGSSLVEVFSKRGDTFIACRDYGSETASCRVLNDDVREITAADFADTLKGEPREVDSKPFYRLSRTPETGYALTESMLLDGQLCTRDISMRAGKVKTALACRSPDTEADDEYGVPLEKLGLYQRPSAH